MASCALKSALPLSLYLKPKPRPISTLGEGDPRHVYNLNCTFVYVYDVRLGFGVSRGGLLGC